MSHAHSLCWRSSRFRQLSTSWLLRCAYFRGTLGLWHLMSCACLLHLCALCCCSSLTAGVILWLMLEGTLGPLPAGCHPQHGQMHQKLLHVPKPQNGAMAQV